MTVTVCPAGQWTDIPDTGGAMLLEARGMGFFVDTSGTKPADPSVGISLPSDGRLTISSGIAVAVYPAGPAAVRAYSNVV